MFARLFKNNQKSYDTLSEEAKDLQRSVNAYVRELPENYLVRQQYLEGKISLKEFINHVPDHPTNHIAPIIWDYHQIVENNLYGDLLIQREKVKEKINKTSDIVLDEIGIKPKNNLSWGSGKHSV